MVARRNHVRAWSNFCLAARVRLRHVRRTAHLSHMLTALVLLRRHRLPGIMHANSGAAVQQTIRNDGDGAKRRMV